MIFLIVFWAQKNERKKGISLNISIMKQKNTEKKEERKKIKLTFFSREETAFLFEKTYYHFT